MDDGWWMVDDWRASEWRRCGGVLWGNVDASGFGFRSSACVCFCLCFCICFCFCFCFCSTRTSASASASSSSLIDVPFHSTTACNADPIAHHHHPSAMHRSLLHQSRPSAPFPPAPLLVLVHFPPTRTAQCSCTQCLSCMSAITSLMPEPGSRLWPARHLSSVICHPSSAIRHPSSVIHHL